MDKEQQENAWYYESSGERIGGINEPEMIALIESGDIRQGTAVWRQGLPAWTRIEDTDLAPHLNRQGPPPLTGEHVNNTIIWILAFAPLIGLFLEGIVAGMVYGSNQFQASRAVSNAEFWYVTLILNVGLSYLDEKKLEKAGTNTDDFKGMVFLVPVYLYQRAQALGHNRAYFGIWVACFAFVLFA